MDERDGRFLDAYKQVEVLCGDLLSSSHGIRAYLEELERIPRFRLPHGEEEYKNLKHLRWLRNKMVHDTVFFNATEEDIRWLKMFYRRILQGEDSLAQWRRKQKKIRPTNPAGKNIISPTPSKHRTPPTWKWAVPLGFLALILLILFAFSR